MALITDLTLDELFGKTPPITTDARQEYFACKRLDCINSDGVARCQIFLAAEMEFGQDFKRDPFLCDFGRERVKVSGIKRGWMRSAYRAVSEECPKCG